MDIRAYAAADRAGCLAVLESIGGEGREAFAAYLDGGPRYFVAEHDGRIVGCGGVGEGAWGDAAAGAGAVFVVLPDAGGGEAGEF